MEENQSKIISHKEWRRLVKKLRRKRIRQHAAQIRDAEEKQLRETLERSADYLNWVIEQEQLIEEQEKKEAEEHAERERLWLEAEIKAQSEWRQIQERKAKARQEQLQQEEIIRLEFELKQEALKKKREELKRLEDEELKRQANIEHEIHEYIDNGSQTPEVLRLVTDSQPGKELCPFFSKTAACKYGDICSRNHRRIALSKIIMISGFYNHFSLEKNSAEYDTDISLEFENSETREHYKEFYKDVVPELESFGRIKTLKCCCNSEIHLRGNLYVEYYTEREAARAWRRLKGRWYGSRQLNCEFANFQSWRNAVCGMTKCPKGRTCNFLHTFRNPDNDYDIKSPPRWMKKSSWDVSSSRGSKMMSEESTRSNRDEHHNWRWSESPKDETNYEDCDEERYKHRESDKRNKRRSKSRDRHSRSRTSHSKSHKSLSSDRKRKKRHSKDEKSTDYSNKYSDIDKENGRDYIRKSAKRKKTQRDMSESEKVEANKRLQKTDRSSSTMESCKDTSTERQQIKQVDNDWDTTDSDTE